MLNHRKKLDPRRYLAGDPPNVDLDGDVLFKRSWGLVVPAAPGVYLIRDLRGLLYVGRSEDLRKRFHQHLEHSHNELLRLAIARPWGPQHFAYIRDERPAELEERLIAHLLPICNERGYRGVLDLNTTHTN